MDALQRFEELIESTIEGPLATATTGYIQPVEMAKRLAKVMDRSQVISASRILAPNDYTVRVSSADYQALLSFRQALERELTTYIRTVARERNVGFVAPPRVVIVEDHTLLPRRTRITATFSETQLPNDDVQVQFTAPVPVVEVRRALQQMAQLMMADGRVVPLDKAVISLGRSLQNDIVIEDKRVSRQHAQIRCEPHGFCLYDLESVNGTYVNGQAIKQILLRDGDQISLGGVEMIFRRSAGERAHGT